MSFKVDPATAQALDRVVAEGIAGMKDTPLFSPGMTTEEWGASANLLAAAVMTTVDELSGGQMKAVMVLRRVHSNTGAYASMLSIEESRDILKQTAKMLKRRFDENDDAHG